MKVITNRYYTVSDGTRIAVDIYFPDNGNTFPTIVYFGPYRKDDWIRRLGMTGLPELYTSRGYVFIIGDIRGSNDSEGVAKIMFDPEKEQADLAELIEQFAGETWCDGNIGMTGISYGFYNSLYTAIRQPSHLKTIVPICGGVTFHYAINEFGLPMSFGFHAYYATLMLAFFGAAPGFREPGSGWRELWQQRLQEFVPWGLEWFGKISDDEYWAPFAIEKMYDQIRIPVFAIGGWWDRYPSDILKLAEGVNGMVKVLVGPWQHGRPDTCPPGPNVDYEVIIRWFDYWLKGEQNGILDEPFLTCYAQDYQSPREYRTGIPGSWQEATQWPPDDLENETWYLQPGGGLNNTAPSDEDTFRYEYDPTIGITTNLDGGIYFGIGMPVDQRPDEPGSVVFTGEPLAEDSAITGIPEARLHFSSTATRMGVIVKLCDVAPDGTVSLVTRGHLNACYWNGLDRPERLEPGRLYELLVELKATSYVFRKDHRVRVAITSAAFPNVFPTPERGTNSIMTSPQYPSSVTLPVVPAGERPGKPVSIKECRSPAPGSRPEYPKLEIRRDDETGEATARLEMRTESPGAGCRLTQKTITETRVGKLNPSDAVVKSFSEFRVVTDEGDVYISTSTIVCQGSMDTVDVNATLEVHENDDRICSRDWTVSHPREFI